MRTKQSSTRVSQGIVHWLPTGMFTGLFHTIHSYQMGMHDEPVILKEQFNAFFQVWKKTSISCLLFSSDNVLPCCSAVCLAAELLYSQYSSDYSMPFYLTASLPFSKSLSADATSCCLLSLIHYFRTKKISTSTVQLCFLNLDTWLDKRLVPKLNQTAMLYSGFGEQLCYATCHFAPYWCLVPTGCNSNRCLLPWGCSLNKCFYGSKERIETNNVCRCLG